MQTPDTISRPEALGARRRRAVLIALSLAVLPIVLSSTMVSVALPTMQRELGATMVELQWIATAYVLAFAGLMLPFGSLGDRWGRARVLSAGLAWFGGASLGAFLARSPAGVIAWRAAMGLGAAAILPQTLAIIVSVFPGPERGRAIGIWAGMNSLGVALGPILGGALVNGLGWPSIFLANVVAAVAALLACAALIPNSRVAAAGRLNGASAILSTAAASALVFGLVQGGAWGWGHPAVVVCLVGALGLGVALVAWERRRPRPMFDLSLFASRRFSGGVAAVVVMSLALAGVTFALSLYLQFVRGYDALGTGLRLLPLAAGIFLGASTASRIVQRFGAWRVVLAGFLVSAAMDCAIAFSPLASPYGFLAATLLGLGLSLGLIAAPATAVLMSAVPPDRASVGSALNTVLRTMAGALGVAIAGSVLSSAYATSFGRGVGTVGDLPAAALAAARESVGAAVVVAGQLPPATGDALAGLARASFMSGWRVLGLISCGLSLVGGVVALQLRLQDRPARETGTGSR